MDIKQRIKKFNEASVPFYISAHDDGNFSLCFVPALMGGEYVGFGQAAFNRYAEKIGEPFIEDGLYTHGSGYEWETVFKKAFENEAGLQKIKYDCEMDGFFCYAPDLSLIEDFGRRFLAMVKDTEGFERLVEEALEEAAEQEAAEEELRSTVRGFLMECPDSDVELMTPEGNFHLKVGQGRQLLDGRMEKVQIGDAETSAGELLGQKITHIGQDFMSDDSHFRMQTEHPKETPDPVMTM